MTAGRVRLAGLAVLAAALPGAAHASFLSGDALDTPAMVLAWIVIFVAPVIAIGLFLVVHVLPEKIAEKNHHPQQQPIKTLCFLSLVFGGLLWPIAWLWAYTRPIGYRMAYGTEKHEHYFIEMGEKVREADTWTTRVIVAEAPEARLPRLQVSVPDENEHDPWEGPADT